MNSKERIRTTLGHKSPDKVPIDFGSTAVTGMHCSAVAKLRDHYGLEKRPVKVHEPYQMLGLVEDDLKAAIGVDVEGFYGAETMFGFPIERWKPFVMNDGLEVLVPGQFNTTKNDIGDTLIYPRGDTTALPSGKMPNDGYFFDAIVRQNHYDEDNLDPEDNLEEFSLLSEENLQRIETGVKEAAATHRAVIASFGGTGFGDIALVPAVSEKDPRGVRDIAEWYMILAAEPDYVHDVFARQTEIALENLSKINDRVGDLVDVAMICGTDFGTQTSSFCSVDDFRSLWAPYYRQINSWIHENTGWKTFKHSCGAVEKFIDDFVDCGFDILNPVQCSAAGMDPKHLKTTYGDRVTFWGGGVDTQTTLPSGAAAWTPKTRCLLESRARCAMRC